MQLAGNIFQEMVLEEAIKDKTAQMEKELNGNDDNNNDLNNEEDFEENKGSEDSDFNDDDEIMQSLREQRINALKEEQRQHQENLQRGHGKYDEISEDQFLPTVTKIKFVVVHWFHKDFERCKIMDHHLSIIAKQHTETKFVRIDAEKCPFFVAKLQIQMLPTVVCFMDGVAFDRIVGFDELGGTDEFKTLLLTRRLVKTGCIKALTKNEKGNMLITKGRARHESSGEDTD